MAKSSTSRAKLLKTQTDKENIPLTIPEQKFVNQYLTNGNNACKAARDAGFPVKDFKQKAARLMKDARIRKAIDNIEISEHERVSWSEAGVAEKFMNIYTEAMAAGKYSEANKAMENIAKIAGVFKSDQKQETKNTGKTLGEGTMIDISAFTSSDEKEDVANDVFKTIDVISQSNEGYTGPEED